MLKLFIGIIIAVMHKTDTQKPLIVGLPPDIQVDKFIRSRRRTIGLQITSEGRLIVRAPLKAAMRDIQSFIEKKQRWITKIQVRAQNQKLLHQPKRYIDGELFPYLGKSFELYLVNDVSCAMRLDNAFYLSMKYRDRGEAIFKAWYKSGAQVVIADRVKIFAARHGLHHGQIRISNARRRWGSCSTKGNLNFSWRLVMAPLIVVDYVVVHELAHLIEKNHSSRFWNRVGGMMPDYEEHKKWLRENEKRLDL